MQTTKILLVEDDRLIIENLTEFLKGEGFEVQYAEGQEKAMRLLEEQEFDLILLDVTLAQGNGYSACTQIKSRYEIPIIFLTALDDEFSVVTGLEMGADDYIVKPFEPKEMVARVKAVLRRYEKSDEKESNKTVSFENLKISLNDYTVIYHGESLSFPPKELELLYFLAENKNQVFTR